MSNNLEKWGVLGLGMTCSTINTRPPDCAALYRFCRIWTHSSSDQTPCAQIRAQRHSAHHPESSPVDASRLHSAPGLPPATRRRLGFADDRIAGGLPSRSVKTFARHLPLVVQGDRGGSQEPIGEVRIEVEGMGDRGGFLGAALESVENSQLHTSVENLAAPSAKD